MKNNWKPIETAPKDGTVISLWVEDEGELSECCWDSQEYCWTEWAQGLGEHGKTWLRIPENPTKWKEN